MYKDDFRLEDVKIRFLRNAGIKFLPHYIASRLSCNGHLLQTASKPTPTKNAIHTHVQPPAAFRTCPLHLQRFACCLPRPLTDAKRTLSPPPPISDTFNSTQPNPNLKDKTVAFFRVFVTEPNFSVYLQNWKLEQKTFLVQSLGTSSGILNI
jgi:hypothetical protein